MKKIALVSAVFPPEPVASAQIGEDLATYLSGQGHLVTVLCPYPSRPAGTRFDSYLSGGGIHVSLENGVEIVRLPSYCSPESRILSRMRESWSFGMHVCRYLERLQPDVVYANTWPLLSQALIVQHCRRRKIPLVLHIQDLYPESLVSRLPSWCRSVVTSALLPLDRWIARRADQIVVISESIRGAYAATRRIEPEKLFLVRNWMEARRFDPVQDRLAACRKYGVPEDRFTFLYLGNIGPVAGVELLIQAFQGANLSKAQLLIAGEGSCKEECMALVKALSVKNVYFVSEPASGNVPFLQSMGDVFLLPMRKGTGASSVPSKLPSYMFSAKPILASVDETSDAARCIREAGCGWVGESGDVKWLAGKMVEVVSMPESSLKEMGQLGKTYALQYFSKSENVRLLANLVLESRSV